MNNRSSQITIYVLKTKDFVITQGEDVLNKNSLQSEEKRAHYSSQLKRLEITAIDSDRSTYAREPEKYEVREVLSLPKKEYQKLLQRRRESLDTYWEAHRATESIIAPYVGEKIPPKILQKRDRKRSAITEPLTLFTRILRKCSDQRQEPH